MKYNKYSVEDFIKDEYFQKWVLDSDSMTDSFWNNWLADYPDKQEVVDKSKRLVLLMSYDEDKLPQKDFDGMWRHIIEKRADARKEFGVQRKNTTQNLLKIAAVFIGLVAVGFGLYQQGYFSVEKVQVAENEPSITLQLDDGTITILDETSSKEVTNASGEVVGQKDKNTIKYDAKDARTETLRFNTLTVPYGKKFGIDLSDGSKVYLNSGSKLRYPINFKTNAPRDVYLDGEAYFTIARDKSRPFTVRTEDMNTKVFGTEFNVSSYKNENNTSTVLVEGSVGVYKNVEEDEDAKELQYIVPGQRAIFKGDEIVVRKAEVAKHIAWRDGKLLFIDDNFDLIKKELERHFNMKIDNQFTALNQKKFTGTFKMESLEKILSVFKEHTPFDYKLYEDEIVIMSSKK